MLWPVPTWWGASTAPWWWVLAIPTLAGALVAVAIRLPGHGGHHPLDGLALTTAPRELGSILLAAFASLAGGVVLGPEAPLLALGAGLAVFAGRGRPAPQARLLVLCGGASALGLVLGNPLIAALLLLELRFLRPAPREDDRGPQERPAPLGALLVLLVALGAGFLVRAGVHDWPGVHLPEFSAGPLPHYPNVQVRDVLVGVAVAVVTGLIVAASARAAEATRAALSARPSLALVAGGAVIGGLALVAGVLSGAEPDVVLFSGQDGLSDLASLAVGPVVIVILAKAAAYAVSLGVGFRGGAVFPALFLGMGVAVVAAALAPGTSLAALAACGLAAGAAVALGLPVTAALLALLLCASAGAAVTAPAIVGAVVGAGLKIALDRRRVGVIAPVE